MGKLIGQKVRQYLESKAHGEKDAALSHLADSAGVHKRTIRRWIDADFPDPKGIYNVALACGCSSEEALALVNECLQEGSKESA